MDQLREAIEELFYFEFVLDDIPIWGFVGYLEESGFLPHSHKVQLLCLHVNCSEQKLVLLHFVEPQPLSFPLPLRSDLYLLLFLL